MARIFSVLLCLALQTAYINAYRAALQTAHATAEGSSGISEDISQCYADSPWVGVKKTATADYILQSNYAAEVTGRTRNPRLIRQKNQMFCGPAAFLHVLAMARPATYVELARDIFCTGKYTHPKSGYFIDTAAATFAEYFGANSILEFEFLTSSSRGCSAQPMRCLDAADWLLEAALLQKVNTWNSPTPDTQTSQLTFPGEMTEWIKNLLPDATLTEYGSIMNYLAGKISTYDSYVGEADWNTMLDVVVAADGQAPTILLTEWSSAGIPQHYVVLVKVDNFKNDCWIKTYGKYQKEDCPTLRTKTFIAFQIDFSTLSGEGAIPKTAVGQMRRDLRDPATTSTPHWKAMPRARFH